MDPVELLGWIAATLTIVTYAMKTMLPLRVAALLSNFFFLCYAMLIGSVPMMAMEAVLLPFNLWRLSQILRLRRRIARASTEAAPDFSLLRGIGRPRHYPAGHEVFRHGDRPTHLFYLDTGVVALDELGISLEAGQIFGEIAFFTDAKARTATARCQTDCHIFAVDEQTFLRLYFIDPPFAMAIMRLITRRLIDGMRRQPEAYGIAAGEVVPQARS